MSEGSADTCVRLSCACALYCAMTAEDRRAEEGRESVSVLS